MRLEDMTVITQYIHLCIENMENIACKWFVLKPFQNYIDFVQGIMLLISIL